MREPPIRSNPQTTKQMRRRLHLALNKVCDPEMIQLGSQIRPGLLPQHVFDCLDGLRLIISLDLLGSTPSVHVSASVKHFTKLWKQLHNLAMSSGEVAGMRILCKRTFDVMNLLAGEPVKLSLVLYTREKGVPHFVVKNNDNDDDWIPEYAQPLVDRYAPTDKVNQCESSDG